MSETLPRLLRLPAVQAATGQPKSTIYKRVKDGTFPAPVKISKRAVAWREADIAAWMQRLVVGGTR